MPIDELYERAMEFGKNMNHVGLSNLYVARTIDHNGNVTSETYGMNAFTNYGFENFFVNGTNWPHNLYIGQATDETTDESFISFLQTPKIIDPITTSAAPLNNTTINYKYPMYYKSLANGDGIITCVCKFQVSTFDYNIEGVGTDVSITEYGIGSAWNQLWTHSWVYDIQGSRTSITKHINEQLEITVYFCMTYMKSMITNGWANNSYAVITTLQRFLGTTRNVSGSNVNMTDTDAGTFKRFNVCSTRNRIYTQSTLTNNQITKYTTLNDFNIINKSGGAEGYYDGFYQYTPGFAVIDRQTMSSPESFDIVVQNEGYNWRTDSITDYMGADVTQPGSSSLRMPFTQMAISHVYSYNRFAGSYSNTISYVNSNDRCYDEIGFSTSLTAPIYYTNRDNYIEMFVYQNLYPNDAILGFDNQNVQTLYATDEYWNRGTWVEISTRYNIPASVRNKRYYLTDTKASDRVLKPIRESTGFAIQPSSGDTQTMAFTINDGSYTDDCMNYDEGYFVVCGTIYVPSENFSWNMGIAETNVQYFCYGKKIVVFTNDASTYYVVNMDTMTQPYKVSVSGIEFVLNNAYKTETHNGIICMQNVSSDVAMVLDTTRSDPGSVNKLYNITFNARMACAVYSFNNKRYVAYASKDDSKLHIYDFDIDDDAFVYDLPNAITVDEINIMCGLNNYVWVLGSTFSYRLTINNTGVWELCVNNMAIATNRSNALNLQITAVNDVLLIYGKNSFNMSQVYYFRTDDASNALTIYNLSDFAESLSYQNYRWSFHLQYVETNTLLLLMNYGRSYTSGNTYYGAGSFIIDFGQWLNPPAGSLGPVKAVLHITTSMSYESTDWGKWIRPYGPYFINRDKLIPLLYVLPLRLVGSTNTISALSTTRCTKNKQWSFTVSNVAPSDYGDTGFPPGTQN